jgi:hypothetical protein
MKASEQLEQVEPIDVDFLSSWANLLYQVEMLDLPAEFVDRILVHTKAGSDVEINVKAMRPQYTSSDDLSAAISQQLDKLGDIIDSIDYRVNIEAVANKAIEATKTALEILE